VEDALGVDSVAGRVPVAVRVPLHALRAVRPEPGHGVRSSLAAGKNAAAALELVWSVTDPPLKALRRVIPPLRLGTVSVDLASLVLLVIVFVLMSYVLPPLIHLTT
jgi:hypothetical protein